MARTNESALQQEVMSWIRQNQYAYLATLDKKQPHVRPIVLFAFNDGYWIVTFSGDSKVQQIANNRWVEICLPIHEEGNTGYVRLVGTASIVTNSNLKLDAIEECYFFDEYFSGADDPDYSLISFDPSDVEYLRPGETFSQSFPL
ncbi:MAG TPA: pyridoxamine 5'-phosphate oxidase family protein, partial [Candidatus Cloacimonadota bacterium]|nr:pyridoxamine 5'-phosphate oxidase family protein [Candidatus Cloacimonadota bacterium]HPS39583.1 pyridoxamine 5'-phosphate oxidase family protein [Candidatus Cloacimonadota bacterium]